MGLLASGDGWEDGNDTGRRIDGLVSISDARGTVVFKAVTMEPYGGWLES